MLARVRSLAVLGIDAYPVDVEVHLATGLPSFTTVGLPQGAVKEGRERVHAALVNSGFEFPLKRITVNLAPADVPKAGSAFDLPIAIGLLIASGQLAAPGVQAVGLVGELGLEGDLRPIRGALPMALGAERAGLRSLIVPTANAAEAGVVSGLAVLAPRTLHAAARHLSGQERLAPVAGGAEPPAHPADAADFADVRGQRAAKRALEVAAAGAHNILLIGPPGAGKTMLARRLPSILPALDRAESLDVTRIHSVAGLLGPGAGLVGTRPFRAPHHTISDAGLSGGGNPPRPGEMSLAHHGVLFLDELPEFRRHVLEVLRQPLEDGVVTLARAATTITYPARFTLAAAMNPCPCGYHGDSRRECICGEEAITRYRRRISGPLVDRIDIHLAVPAPAWNELAGADPEEPSNAVRARVEAARARQLARAGVLNAHLPARQVRRTCRLGAAGIRLLEDAMQRLGFSARAYARILKLARTIADLEGAAEIDVPHLGEAIQYRSLDRRRCPAPG